jgi:hypothetical protein
LNKFFVSLLIGSLLLACHTDDSMRMHLAEVKDLLEQYKGQAQRLEEINNVNIGNLNHRLNLLKVFDGFKSNEDIMEVLASGLAFMQELPLMTEEINDELANNQQQLESLIKDMNQQLYTAEEVTLFLVLERTKFEQLLMKVDYVHDRFSAWQLNAETIESAMRNNN